jgi:hypothetical protein
MRVISFAILLCSLTFTIAWSTAGMMHLWREFIQNFYRVSYDGICVLD